MASDIAFATATEAVGGFVVTTEMAASFTVINVAETLIAVPTDHAFPDGFDAADGDDSNDGVIYNEAGVTATMASASPTAGGRSMNPVMTASDTDTPDHGLSPAALGGIIAGSVIGFLLLVGLIVFLFWRKRRAARRAAQNQHTVTNFQTIDLPPAYETEEIGVAAYGPPTPTPAQPEKLEKKEKFEG